MFLLAHLSDPHVASQLRLGLRDFAGKRLWGFLSWRLRRQHIHRRTVLDALAEDLLLQHPDHVVVTGDITNISLPAEFIAASHWLASLGQPEFVSIIPGNHDAYVHVPWERSWVHWDDYMRSDADDAAATNLAPRFPFVRRRRHVAIVGLSTAVRSAPGMAVGRLGAAQLHATSLLLEQLRRQGLFRVVLLHHPPITAAGGHHKRLIDAEAFMAMLAEAGAELVLHGHDHVHRMRSQPSSGGEIAVLGAASASAAAGRGHVPAQYNLYRIAPSSHGWTIDVCIRGIEVNGQFATLQRQRLTVARAHAGLDGGATRSTVASDAKEG